MNLIEFLKPTKKKGAVFFITFMLFFMYVFFFSFVKPWDIPSYTIYSEIIFKTVMAIGLSPIILFPYLFRGNEPLFPIILMLHWWILTCILAWIYAKIKAKRKKK